MIKLLILSLLLISCKPEVSYKNLDTPKSGNTISTFELLEFKPEIDMMIMFLWPKNLGPKDEEEVVEIISRSRKITEVKENVLRIRSDLKSELAIKRCDCHVIGICEDDEEMDDDIMLECDDIYAREAENEKVLENLKMDHEFIKEKLKAIGAINIDVGVDDDPVDIGEFHLNTKIIKLNKFGYLGQEKPIKFKIIPYSSDNMKAKFSFKVDQELFTGDLGISNKKYNVIFSGEIETDGGQRGLIYWEHIK